MTRRTTGTPPTNSNKKDPGKPQQANRDKAQKKSGTGKPSIFRVTCTSSPFASPLFLLFLVVRSAAKDRPAPAPAPSGRKKTGGRPNAPPITMDDDSDADAPAVASQDRGPSPVTHPRRQPKAAPNESASARQSVRTSYRQVAPDDSDDEEENGVDRTDSQDEAEDDDEDIYGGIDGATAGEDLENEVGCFLYLYIHQLTIEIITSSLLILTMKYRICAASHL